MASSDLKYQHLRSELLMMIRERLSPGDPLPTERALMAQFVVSRATVRAAIRSLIEDGVVWRRHGSGTYVSNTRTVGKSLSQLTSFTEDMRLRGLEPSTRVLHAKQSDATVGVARDLRLSPGAPVWDIHRLRFADREPIMLERVRMPIEVAPGLIDADLSGSLYAILDEEYELLVFRASQRIRATVLRSEEADLLHLPRDSPAMHIRRVSFTADGEAIERADSIYRGDRYEFTLNVSRRAAGY